MRHDEVLSRSRAAEPEIRAFGVGTLYLFGSAALMAYGFWRVGQGIREHKYVASIYGGGVGKATS